MEDIQQSKRRESIVGIWDIRIKKKSSAVEVSYRLQ